MPCSKLYFQLQLLNVRYRGSCFSEFNISNLDFGHKHKQTQRQEALRFSEAKPFPVAAGSTTEKFLKIPQFNLYRQVLFYNLD